MENPFYFAYGSNMNLDQMGFRCPHARVAGTVCLEDYRLAFCGMSAGNGVATIFPEKGWTDMRDTRICMESKQSA